MKNTGKIFTALLTGAALGSILGVLYAPDRGSRTRRKISGHAQKFADNVRDRTEAGMDVLNNIKDKIVG